jgi:hypothetical protein
MYKYTFTCFDHHWPSLAGSPTLQGNTYTYAVYNAHLCGFLPLQIKISHMKLLKLTYRYRLKWLTI